MPVVFSSDYIDEINRLKLIYDQAQFGLVTEAAGEEASGGIIASLMNVIKQIFNMISNGLKKITNSISYMCLSKEKKVEYDEFCEWIKQNPAVKAKTITVKDWKKLSGEYARIEKELLDAYNNEQVDANGLNLKANDMFNNLNSMAKAATAAITVDAAMYFAKSSPEIAKGVQVMLLTNQNLLKNIEDEIGTKATNKVLNNINKLTKETAYRRILTKLGLHKQRTLSETMDGYVNSMLEIKNVGNSKIKLAGFAMKHKAGTKVLTQANKYDPNVRRGVEQVKGVVNDVKQITRNAQAISANPIDAAYNAGMNYLLGASQ